MVYNQHTGSAINMNANFENWAKKNNWKIVKQTKSIPQTVFDRYGNIPEVWLDFIEGYGSIMNSEENIWFLTAESYYPKSEDEWRYNEFELISLDAADGDDDFVSEITDFWNNHFPIIMSVGNGYEYYAIELNSGNIVCGFEPEFEEAEFVADSFNTFLEMLMNNEL